MMFATSSVPAEGASTSIAVAAPMSRRCVICGPILDSNHYTSKQHRENSKLRAQGKPILTYEQSCKKFHIRPAGAVALKTTPQETVEQNRKHGDQTPTVSTSHEKRIQDQQTDGIGGSRHQHGMPSGRYSHRGACSSARHRPCRSKKS